jgi:hypothetical protein
MLVAAATLVSVSSSAMTGPPERDVGLQADNIRAAPRAAARASEEGREARDGDNRIIMDRFRRITGESIGTTFPAWAENTSIAATCWRKSGSLDFKQIRRPSALAGAP